MKKVIKKLMSLGLCLTLGLVALSGSATAADSNNRFVTLNKKDAFVDPSSGLLIIPFKKEKDKLVPVSKREYLDSTQKPIVTKDQGSNTHGKSQLDIISPTADYREYWLYTETLTSTEYGTIQQVSSGITCTTPTCSISKAVTATVSASFSTSATIEQDAIAAGASFTWQYQLTDQSTYQFNLNQGDSGYIGFKPRFNRSSGVLKKYSNWDGYLGISKNAWGLSPKKTSNGEADGYYVFVYTDY
ncbi:hypothetical protein FOI68_18080 [Brevibacillus sp. LEMMJ03]|uniref:DUF6060 domain-containing protein n=1 Tax=Brevibacillus sp. LEMMJ03 TaxID=2595056 RepID=UPI0006971DB0|nr:hypothetical protein [Brevibacillus sp. LEMMJ03]TRY24147.1 hypothetical protein FOI68_18080 [Brevibacillus sp. LEMMJ03]